MPTKGNTHYTRFSELLEEIVYAHEDQYPPIFTKNDNGVENISFYKLHLNSEGQGQYKTSLFTFEPHLWLKVKILASIITPTEAEKVLYE